MSDQIKKQYSHPFYAIVDADVPEPRPCIGWCEPGMMSSHDHLPEDRHLVPVTAEQWEKRLLNTNGFEVRNGQVVERAAVDLEISLVARAEIALRIAQDHVMREYLSIGEVPPAEWVQYQKTLRAIIAGTDTVATELPQVPAA
ncbi:hypothetical protein AZ09_04145 [Acetobacter aceti 1023]|nr:hypothetical protein AZ09_04145 [Acetobacter aceti 1023]